MLQSLSVKNAPPKPDDWDGNWRCVEHDPITQISEWYLYDDSDPHKPVIRIRKIQHNINAILDANKAELNAQNGVRWGDGKKVATIPEPIFEALGLNDALRNKDRRKFRQILNDGDFSKLRTFSGRL